jgi:carbonic anhydrase
MANDITQLIERNKVWAGEIASRDPSFFDQLSINQRPQFLWIGCSDSRVPPNQITGSLPGEIFTHQNVGNLVQLNDVNCMSAIKFALEELDVTNIILCGHYGCGAIKAIIDNSAEGLLKKWLEPIAHLYQKNKAEFADLSDDLAYKRLAELNVIAQVNSLCRSNSVLDRWANDKKLDIYALIYDVGNGFLKDLGVNISSKADLFEFQRSAYF